MRAALLLIFVTACGGAAKQGSGPSDPDLDPDPTPTAPKRSQLQVRQDAACEAVGPRLTRCAIEDNQRQSPEERTKADAERTAPLNTREFIKACTAQAMSSRQVRVYEVCLVEESECEPFLSCLDNAQPQK